MLLFHPHQAQQQSSFQLILFIAFNLEVIETIHFLNNFKTSFVELLIVVLTEISMQVEYYQKQIDCILLSSEFLWWASIEMNISQILLQILWVTHSFTLSAYQTMYL